MTALINVSRDERSSRPSWNDTVVKLEITTQHERAREAWVYAAHHQGAISKLREGLKSLSREELEELVAFAADYVNAVIREGEYTVRTPPAK